MKSYIEITSAEELESFLHETVTFHDSILKEMQMVNRGFLMENKSMDMDLRFDSRLLFQVQWEPIAFEVIATDIQQISAIGAQEYAGSGGVFHSTPVQLIELSLDNKELFIQCKRFFYKLRPELIGCTEHLGSQVPSHSMINASHLEGGWRQCANCSNAWEVDIRVKISTCPSCNQVTDANGT